MLRTLALLSVPLSAAALFVAVLTHAASIDCEARGSVMQVTTHYSLHHGCMVLTRNGWQSLDNFTPAQDTYHDDL